MNNPQIPAKLGHTRHKAIKNTMWNETLSFFMAILFSSIHNIYREMYTYELGLYKTLRSERR
jgi:hypothetical protein